MTPPTGAPRVPPLRRVPAIILCLLLSGAGVGSAAPKAVELVVDCSVAMWRTLSDGTPGLVATRLAIDELGATLSAREQEKIGLRLMGSGQLFTAPEACQDTSLALAPGTGEGAALAGILDPVTPRGRRPLVAAVVAAAADLGEAATGRRIVLVTAGQDDCGGDRSAAAAALRSGIELRVVGVALDPPSLASFEPVAPTRNAASVAELTAALRWAITGEDDGNEAPQAGIVLRVVRGTAPQAGVQATLRSVVTGEAYPLAQDDGALRGRVPGGQYSLTLADGTQEAGDRLGIVLPAGSEVVQTLDTGDEPGASLQVDSGPWTGGGDLEIHFAGAPGGRQFVEVVVAGAPDAAWITRAAAEGPAGTVRLLLPPGPSGLELRLVQEVSNGLLRPLAARPLELEPQEAELQVAGQVAPGELVAVSWSGPGRAGDEIVIAAAAASPADRPVAAAAGNSPVTLTAPEKQGSYEVRYLSALSGEVLASAPLEVAPIPITLQVPERVAAGRTFTVRATPAPPAEDQLTLARPEAPSQDYLLWRPAAATVEMEAPLVPGRYEVRCLASEGGGIVARAPIEVAAVPVSLEAPPRVPAGSRFKVVWTGPDAPGDFIAVAPEGAPRRKHLDWAYTSQGSPADLAAPFDPGTYEIRYISGVDLSVLASRALAVD